MRIIDQTAMDPAMDPQACLNRLFHAVQEAEFVQAQWALCDLLAWHAKGGHMPDLGLALLALDHQTAVNKP
jgi:hypothetical protein